MKKLFVIFLLALIAVKTTAVLLRGPVPLERDALGYWKLSALVLQGDLLMLTEPIAYRTPIYPWFLASIRSVAGQHSLWAISLIQSMLWIAAAGIASRIAFRITKLPLASVFTLVALLPPVSGLTFCSTILSEALFLFLLMLNLLAVVNYCDKGGLARAIWVGVTLAVALLTRPVVLLLWVPHLLYGFMTIRRRRPNDSHRFSSDMPMRRGNRIVAHALLAAATVGLFCGPWLMRNDFLFGRPFLTEFLGRNLWIVAFQDESGAGLSLPDTEASRTLQTRLDRVGAAQQWQATWGVSNALVQSGLRDPDADRLMKQVAVEAIGTELDKFLYQALRRSVNFWRCAATELPVQGARSGPYYGQTAWQHPIPLVEWAIEHRWSRSVPGNTLLMFILIASLGILAWSPSTRPHGVWLALVLAYFSIVTGTLEIPAYRYRMVVEPVVAMAIGSAVAVLLSRRRREATLVDTH